MILPDTPVWIDHSHSADLRFVALLDSREALMHPVVIGELACGNLPNRDVVLTGLKRLPVSLVASDDEALSLVERHRLIGRCIGYIDARLLASVALADSALLCTLDRWLMDAAAELCIAYMPEQERRTIL